MLALDVFAMVLQHLKGKALEIIGDNTTIEYGPSDIKWVITVPAIWRASAKVFMREAAYEVRVVCHYIYTVHPYAFNYFNIPFVTVDLSKAYTMDQDNLFADIFSRLA